MGKKKRHKRPNLDVDIARGLLSGLDAARTNVADVLDCWLFGRFTAEAWREAVVEPLVDRLDRLSAEIERARKHLAEEVAG